MGEVALSIDSLAAIRFNRHELQRGAAGGTVSCRVSQEGFLAISEASRSLALRKPIPPGVRQAVFLRDAGRCTKCGSLKNLHFDHIIPLAKGGGNQVENVQVLCAACNLSKGARIE
jgi:hypothetical protein